MASWEQLEHLNTEDLEPEQLDGLGAGRSPGKVALASSIGGGMHRGGRVAPGKVSRTHHLSPEKASVARETEVGAKTPSRVPSPVLQALHQESGRPLGNADRWGSMVGGDVSDARVVTGSTAASAASSISARAFTVGNRMFFGGGNYTPQTEDGAALVRHELTHVVQQRGAPMPAYRDLSITSRSDSAEHEARGNASGVGRTSSRGHQATVAREDGKPQTYVSNKDWVKMHGPQLGKDLHVLMRGVDMAMPVKHAEFGKRGPTWFAFLSAGPLYHGGKMMSQLEAVLAPKDVEGLVGVTRTGRGATYDANVAVAIRQHLVAVLRKRLAVIIPRYLYARNQAAIAAKTPETAKGAAVPQPHPTTIIQGHPLDMGVIAAVCSPGVVEMDLASYRTANPSEKNAQELPKLRKVDFTFSAREGLWTWVKVSGPEDPSIEEVSKALYGTEIQSFAIEPAAPYFGFDPGRLTATNKKLWKALVTDPTTKESKVLGSSKTAVRSGKYLFLDGQNFGAMRDTRQAEARGAAGEPILLAQAKGFELKGKAAKADTAAVLKRISTGIMLLQSGKPHLGRPDWWDWIIKRLETRAEKIKAGGDTEAAKWNTQTAAQFWIIKEAVDGVIKWGTIRKGIEAKAKASGGEIPDYLIKPVSNIAFEFRNAADMSDMAASGSKQLEKAKALAAQYPITMMEGILAWVRVEIEKAKEDPSKQGVGGEKGWRLADMRRRELRLRAMLEQARDQLIKDPAKAQKMVKEVMGQVTNLQERASMLGAMSSILEQWKLLLDTYPTYYGWGDTSAALNNMAKWHGRWVQAYAKMGNSKWEEQGKAEFEKLKADMPALKADFEKNIKLIKHTQKVNGWIELGRRITIMVGIAIITAGVGAYVEGALLAAGGAAFGTTALGAFLGTMVVSGAEAATFTVLTTLIFEEDISLKGVMFSFLENWLLFGAMRGLSMGYEAAVGAKFAATMGGKVLGGGVQLSAMIGYTVIQAKMAADKAGRPFTATDALKVAGEALTVYVATAIFMRSQAGQKFMGKLRAAGTKSQLAEFGRTYGPKLKIVEAAHVANMNKAAALMESKNLDMVADVLAKDAATLKTEIELLKGIKEWVAENPVKAKHNLGLDAKAMTARIDTSKAALEAAKRSGLALKLEALGADVFMVEKAEFDKVVKDYRELGDRITLGKDKVTGNRTARVRNTEGFDIKLVEKMPGETATTFAKPVKTKSKASRLGGRGKKKGGKAKSRRRPGGGLRPKPKGKGKGKNKGLAVQPTPQQVAANLAKVEVARAQMAAADAKAKATVDGGLVEMVVDGQVVYYYPELISRVTAGGGFASTLNAASLPKGKGTVTDHLAVALGPDPWSLYGTKGGKGKADYPMGQRVGDYASKHWKMQPGELVLDQAAWPPSYAFAGAVAVTRAASGMPTYRGAMVVEVIVAPKTGPKVAGANVRIKLKVGSKEFYLFAKSTDVAVGPGSGRKLGTAQFSADGKTPLDAAAAPKAAEMQAKLEADGRLVYGDTHLHRGKGGNVLISGGGASAAWNAWFATTFGGTVKWIARLAGKDGGAPPAVAKLKEINAKLKEPGLSAAEKLKLTEQRDYYRSFGSAMLPRNMKKGGAFTLKGIEKVVDEVASVTPTESLPGGKLPNGKKAPTKPMVWVTFKSGKTGLYDQVVISHGQDPVKGGAMGMVKTKFKVVEVDGQVVALQSVDGHIRILGAAMWHNGWLSRIVAQHQGRYDLALRTQSLNLNADSKGVSIGIVHNIATIPAANKGLGGGTDTGTPPPKPNIRPRASDKDSDDDDD